MLLTRRAEKLLAEVREMARYQRRRTHSSQCAGATLVQIIRLVAEATPPESRPVLADIFSQMAEYHQRPPREIANGKLKKDGHGFAYWLGGLQAGCSTLPETMPPALLLAWRNGHAHHPAHASPMPCQRCEDCLLVLPNCTPDGFDCCITPCPVCGGTRLSHKKLSGPPWDPMHIYTPLPPGP
jgi:hypothetical protein